jgi:hypothetical protein
VVEEAGKRPVEEDALSPDELITLAALRKRIRGGYNGDGGTEHGWVHKEAFSNKVTDQFHEAEAEARERYVISNKWILPQKSAVCSQEFTYQKRL